MWKVLFSITLWLALQNQTLAEPSEFIYQDQGRGSAKERGGSTKARGPGKG